MANKELLPALVFRSDLLFIRRASFVENFLRLWNVVQGIQIKRSDAKS